MNLSKKTCLNSKPSLHQNADALQSSCHGHLIGQVAWHPFPRSHSFQGIIPLIHKSSERFVMAIGWYTSLGLSAKAAPSALRTVCDYGTKRWKSLSSTKAEDPQLSTDCEAADSGSCRRALNTTCLTGLGSGDALGLSSLAPWQVGFAVIPPEWG